MNQVILTKLSEIEAEKGIRILYACESGSRAWGFPSPDSDYDVRFIYVRPMEWYLSLQQKKDMLDIMVDEVLDINGWDLRKVLQLAKKTNATPFEWLQSPTVYRQEDNFQAKAWNLLKPFFNPVPGMFHYLGLARNSLTAATQGEVIRLKKYFYVLRPILAARWIASKQEAPPMEFHPLLATLADRPDLLAEIETLLDIKKDVSESYTMPPVPALETFFKAEFNRLQELGPKMSTQTDDVEKLNSFFVETLKRYV